MEWMTRQCRECGTVYNWASSYCNACGCNFTKDPPRDRGEKWQYLVCAIVAGLAAAVLQWVLTT
jgi:hypothetical protein